MRRTRFDQWPCSIARTTDLLGDWWTPLVLRQSFYGARRFEDFVEALGIARNVLTERLNRLVDASVLVKVAYHEHPARYEYRLTDKGRDLFGILAAMIRWGDDWLAGDQGAPITLIDRATGEPIRPLVVDENTGQKIDVRRITVQPGPGLPKGLHGSIAARRRDGV